MQNQDLFGLTDDDRKKVQRAVDAVRPLGGPTGTLGGSPDIYVAKTPEGGIPALTIKDDDDYDHPGCAECDVYQILPSNTDGEDWDLQPMSDVAFPVYNLTSDVISGWISVARDKSGQWIALVGGSGMPPGVAQNDILYWDVDQEAWIILSAPAGTGTGTSSVISVLAVVNGVIQWLATETFSCPE